MPRRLTDSSREYRERARRIRNRRLDRPERQRGLLAVILFVVLAVVAAGVLWMCDRWARDNPYTLTS